MKKLFTFLIILISFLVFSQEKKYSMNGNLMYEKYISDDSIVYEYNFYYDYTTLKNITLKVKDSIYQSYRQMELGEPVITIGVLKNGMKQGEWRTYLGELGNVLYWKGTYLNNEIIGKSTYFYPYSEETMVGPENKEGRFGEWIIYNSKGVLIEKGNFENDIRSGLWKFYNDDGTYQKQIIYYKGEKTGIDTVYFDNRKIKNITKYSDKGDVLKKIEYYENGQLKSSYNQLTKDNKYFYANGQIVEDGKVENKKRTGKWVGYYENGSISWTVSYLENKYNGTKKSYFPNGKIESIENYKSIKYPKYNYYQQLKHGEFLEYSEKGILLSKSNYTDGREEGEKETYYKNGQLKSKETFKKGVEVGKYLHYYENGQIMIEGNRLDYKEKEIDPSPFSDNSIQESYPDNRTGIWKFYYKNGIIEKTGKYYDGSPAGEWKHYYKDGSLRKIYNYN